MEFITYEQNINTLLHDGMTFKIDSTKMYKPIEMIIGYYTDHDGIKRDVYRYSVYGTQAIACIRKKHK